MLGTCKTCGKLVTLRRGPLVTVLPDWVKPRSCDMYPVDHENDDGQPCAGAKRAL